MGHRAGRTVEFDWSGPTIQLTDSGVFVSSRACAYPLAGFGLGGVIRRRYRGESRVSAHIHIDRCPSGQDRIRCAESQVFFDKGRSRHGRFAESHPGWSSSYRDDKVARGVGAAHAADDPLLGTNATGGSVTSVVDISRQYNNIGYHKRITYCGVGTAGATCTLSKSTTVSRDIQLGMNLSRTFVAASLNISDSASKSVTVACTSPPMQPGQIWSAYPYGTRLTYRIVTRTTASASYTNWLYAFNPTGGIYCRL